MKLKDLAAGGSLGVMWEKNSHRSPRTAPSGKFSVFYENPVLPTIEPLKSGAVHMTYEFLMRLTTIV